MKKDRQELEITLYKAIKESKENKWKNREYLTSKLGEYGISVGKTVGIYGTTIPLVTLSNAELYLFTKVLYEVTQYNSIEIDKWFTLEEIKMFDQYKAEQTYKGNIIALHNVDQTADNHFVCTKATYIELAKIISQGLITYNLRTQREAKIVVFGNKYIEIPDIRENPVREMTGLMVKGKFKPNTIVWNIRKTGRKRFKYDVKDRTLYIEVDGIESFVDIIDGMHRLQSIIRTIEEDPNNQGYSELSIFNYSEEEAQELIEQEDHKTPMNKTHIAAFKNSDEYVIMAKDIGKYGTERNNELFNKIAMSDIEIRTQEKYVTVETFSKAIKYNFGEFGNPRDISTVQKFLIGFFNELLGILKEKYTKENSIVFENNTFIGYILLASILIKEENWKEALEDILNSINFSNDSEWTNVGIFSNKLNSSLIKKISEHFKKAGVVNV